MEIGIPRERKEEEHRVALTPDGVATLSGDGHEILVEHGAGTGAGFTDEEYREAGASLVDRDEVWDADLNIKVKEPLEEEYGYLDEDTTLFTYFHLAADEELTEEVLESGMTAIAYETVEDGDDLPLLEPMSEVAGRMAPLMGAYHQSRPQGGKGVLPPGTDGVDAANVTVVGGGTVGSNAAEVAAGMGADVTVLDIDEKRLEELEGEIPYDIKTRESTEEAVSEEVRDTDILVGSVLVAGAKAPTVVYEEDVRAMDDGSVVVDVAVDQGGCVETTEHATSHSNPTYERYGVLHYAVDNMPAAYANTATRGLEDATLSYVRDIAEKGWRQAMEDDPGLRRGLNAADGELTYEQVADAFDMSFSPPGELYDDLEA
ncbi:MAG: alanine dehydrogenase [Candidatus Nanohaloarchaea archaeon]|nr:alanine dehydrogenase [Candidatus Nanohaloarchaea archaeon]